ncbi:Sin3 histone deacetylase corepressor complex component SDS3 [Thoreauomyces humboldtii]|nr:Sin3 histone deacetylase corepressor complex component SDS3 [Thoreauomyces humboldtii]
MPELVSQARLIGGDRFNDAPGQISHQSRPSSAPVPITIDTPAAPRVGPPSAPASTSVNLAPDDRRPMVASSLSNAAIIESDAFPDHPVERINPTPVVIKPNARGFGAQEEAKNGYKRLTVIRREEEHPHSTTNPEHHLLDQEKRVRSHKKRKIVPSDLPAKPPISPAEVSLAAPRAVARTKAAATRSLLSSPRKVGAYVEPVPIQIDEPDTPLSKKERKIKEVMDRLNRLDKDFSGNKERVFRYRLDEFRKGSRQALAGTCPELQDMVEELERERLKEVEDAEIFRDVQIDAVSDMYDIEYDQAVVDFETIRAAMKQSMLAFLEEKKRRVRELRENMDVLSTIAETTKDEQMTTSRKATRAASAKHPDERKEKRRKGPLLPSLSVQVSEESARNDLDLIRKARKR